MKQIGTNVQIDTNGNKLTIEVDLSKSFGRSKSGKTITVATTNGFAKLETGAMLSLNVNKYPGNGE